MIGNETVQAGSELALSSLPIVGGPLGTFFQNQENARLNQENRDYNLKMWNLQNEYNSPSAQMQRFRKAGLNPNLVVSQGSPGNASSVPSSSPAHYNQPKADWGEVISFMDTLASIQLKENQAKNELKKGVILDEQGYQQQMENYFNWNYPGLANDIENYRAGKFSSPYTERFITSLLNKRSSTQLNEALLRIRTQEAGLNEVLKPLGFTASDPGWLRFIATLATKSGMLKKFFFPNLKAY